MASSAPGPAKASSFPDGTTDYIPLRGGKKHDMSKPHITELPMTITNWYKHINWLNCIFVLFIPMAGLTATYWVPAQRNTVLFAIFYYFHTGLGITAGYHRLWSHRGYKATLPLRIYLVLMGAASVEGSARWWSREHRVHHRYTDTIKDPYAVSKGLAYSHMGWMIMKQNPRNKGRTDISDLNEDGVVVWQHKNYVSVVIMMAFLFPALVCGYLWNDFWGGLVYAGVLRTFFVQQATFCVNSLAHWLGDQPFDDRNSPRDHVLTALVTLGEGYHNFHHEFPSDYRNAIEWWQYDPTKWAIWTWSKIGLAYDLKQFRANEIEKGRVQQLQKKLDERRATLNWGTPLDQLPVLSWDAFQAEVKTGKGLVVIGGVIHDVSEFITEHPGGKALIASAIGKDATSIFNGGVYLHSNAAHNLLSTMRVGVLHGGCEVEIWKQAKTEKDGVPLYDSAGRRITRAGDQVTRVSAPVASADAA